MAKAKGDLAELRDRLAKSAAEVVALRSAAATRAPADDSVCDTPPLIGAASPPATQAKRDEDTHVTLWNSMSKYGGEDDWSAGRIFDYLRNKYSNTQLCTLIDGSTPPEQALLAARAAIASGVPAIPKGGGAELIY